MNTPSDRPVRSGVGAGDDRIAVEACVRDYFEAWFSGDAERMRGALHPELAKRGWVSHGPGGARLERETSDSMVDFTQLGVGTRHPLEKRTLDVEIVDVDRDIASAVIRSPIYREYVHLVATSEGWRIINTLWRPA